MLLWYVLVGSELLVVFSLSGKFKFLLFVGRSGCQLGIYLRFHGSSAAVLHLCVVPMEKWGSEGSRTPFLSFLGSDWDSFFSLVVIWTVSFAFSLSGEWSSWSSVL